MLIEFTGIVGSGKTSLENAAFRSLNQQGIEVLNSEEALLLCMERTVPGRASIRLVRDEAKRRKLLRQIYAQGFARAARAMFERENALLVRHAETASPAQRVLPAWHWAVIRRLLLDAGARARFLQRSLKPGETAFVGESLVHRAVNLFAWETGVLDLNALRRYFQLLPPGGPVIVVQSELKTALQRARGRGLPIRLRDKRQAEVERFMHNSVRIVETAVAELSDRRQIIVIENNAAFSSAAGALETAVKGLLQPPARLDLPQTVSILE